MTRKKVRPSATPEVENRYRTIEATQRGIYNDTESRPPPIVTTGVVAWVRDNLFKTPFDIVLTLVATAILISLAVNILSWAINDANWLVITRNLRQFMVGSYAVEQLWRVQAVVLAIAFAIGFTWYAYNDKLSKKLVGTLLAGVAAMVLIPLLVREAVPPIGAYLAVGTTSIASGSVTETPLELLSFVGQANEVIEIEMANDASNEEAIPALAGFLDRASNAILNNARNRLTTQDQIANIERQLAGDLLTDNQRTAFTTQVGNLSVPEPVSAAYAINSVGVDVEIIDGSTLEVLASATLTSDSEPLHYTLPNDGWYILRKTLTGESEDAAIAMIRATGIYPVIERNFTRARAVGAPERVLQYIRLTDDYTTEAIRPSLDGVNTPVMFVTDNQYRGERPFSDYMRIAGAPFLTQLSRGLIPMAALAVIGYLAGAGLVAVGHRSTFERRQNESPRQPAQTASYWLWILILVLGFPLIYGVNQLAPYGLFIIIAQILWVGWMFFVGIHLNRKWGVPLFGLMLVIGVGMAFFAERLENSGTPNAAVGILALFGVALFITKMNGKLGGFGSIIRTVLLAAAVILVLFMEPLGISVSVTGLLGVVVWLLVGFYATNMGMGRRMSWNSKKAMLALIITGVLCVLALVIALLLSSGTITLDSSASNLLPITDTRSWGGLLLTMMLTVVAILASFPLGVLLALGRRSDLPVVKGVCIFYIELVRGVPLITVLFMAQLLVPLVNPALASVDNVFRAMVGLTLFSAAYLAENVRGGLQSVPHGQEEAAKAVGLNGMQTILLITLPQALRAVIPALVGQCIALFKDTSLVALVGLIDLTGTARTTIAQPEFVGMQGEVYLFISVIYFIISYMMAYVSRRIEFSGSGAANNRNI